MKLASTSSRELLVMDRGGLARRRRSRRGRSTTPARRLRGTLRNSVAVIIIGHSPTLISGVPSSALSAAIAKSHATTSPQPPASA